MDTVVPRVGVPSARALLDGLLLAIGEVDEAGGGVAGGAGAVSDGDVARPPDQAARFRRLYDDAYRRVLAYALRRTQQQADADDVVAEVFLVAWRRLEDVPTDDEAAMAWLYATGRRVLANRHRAARRQRRLTAKASAVLRPDAPDVAEQVGDGSNVVVRALDALRESDREILRLAAWEDLPRPTIARALGISEEAVATRLHRARKRLSDALAAAEPA